jgi:hypothetical protein
MHPTENDGSRYLRIAIMLLQTNEKFDWMMSDFSNMPEIVGHLNISFTSIRLLKILH